MAKLRTRAKKSPAQLDREIAEAKAALYHKGGLLYDLRPRPINPRKRVRHFSRTTDNALPAPSSRALIDLIDPACDSAPTPRA